MQAIILTKDDKMILTPTHHVFDMYKVHQDAALLPSQLNCGKYGFDKESMPSISVSASRDKEGRIHISLCNLDPNRSHMFRCELRGFTPRSVSGRVLTSDDMTAHNTFDGPESTTPAEFKDAKLKNDGIVSILPAKSVVLLEIN